MTQWFETRDGKSYWMMNFTAEEMILLRKYHKNITRLTKIDFTGALGSHHEVHNNSSEDLRAI